MPKSRNTRMLNTPHKLWGFTWTKNDKDDQDVLALWVYIFIESVVWTWLNYFKQEGSHEPECMHVLGLRVKTSAIGKRNFFSCILHAYRLTEGTWSTVHEETTNQHNNITTSTTKSPPAQQHHQRNEITTKSPAQWNHQRNKITSTTTSPAQRKHQHNEITSEQHQRNNITSTTKSTVQRNHQHNEITSTTTSPAQRKHQHNEITSEQHQRKNHQHKRNH